LTPARLLEIVEKHPGALIWLTGGIPCKDVSSLNPFGRGCDGPQTGLYLVAARILEYLRSISDKICFTFECTRMKISDRQRFSEAFKAEPIEINNGNFAPLSRPRLWWIGGTVPNFPSVVQKRMSKVSIGVKEVRPDQKPLTWKECILPGYIPCSVDEGAKVLFKCLTTKTARKAPGLKPVGLGTASAEAVERWANDLWAQAPYQYELCNMVANRKGQARRLLPCEEELLMGYPWDYTACLPTEDKKDVTVQNPLGPK